MNVHYSGYRLEFFLFSYYLCNENINHPKRVERRYSSILFCTMMYLLVLSHNLVPHGNAQELGLTQQTLHGPLEVVDIFSINHSFSTHIHRYNDNEGTLAHCLSVDKKKNFPFYAVLLETIVPVFFSIPLIKPYEAVFNPLFIGTHQAYFNRPPPGFIL